MDLLQGTEKRDVITCTQEVRLKDGLSVVWTDGWCREIVGNESR